MVKTIREEIKKLKLGSKMREDVWMRELQRCGARLAYTISQAYEMGTASKTKVPQSP